MSGMSVDFRFGLFSPARAPIGGAHLFQILVFALFAEKPDGFADNGTLIVELARPYLTDDELFQSSWQKYIHSLKFKENIAGKTRKRRTRFFCESEPCCGRSS
jgi:hypothetical protein